MRAAEQKDYPAHSNRAVRLGITGGRGTTSTPVRALRRLGGFANRSESWLEHLFRSTRPSLDEDRKRYWGKLEQMYARCEGCERLQCSHVYGFGASYLQEKVEEDEEQQREMWQTRVFGIHGVEDVEECNAIKRVLMVLEEDLDLDYAPCLVDLVCLLSLYLSEIQTYAAVRRMMTTSSSTFVRVSKRDSKRTSSAPRRLLPTTFASTRTLGLIFMEALKRADPHLHSVFLAHDHVQQWLERWLIPVLPMNHVVTLIDCLIAGDDWKLIYRVLYKTLKLNKSALLKTSVRTDIVKIVASSSSSTKSLEFAQSFAKRRVLIALESVQLNKVGRSPTKCPPAHVSRQAFAKSTTVLTYEAASRLVRMIPRHLRHTSVRMRSIFQSDIGPIGDSNLTHLYQHCAKEKNCTFFLLISAKVPSAEDDLNEATYSSLHRTSSTNFSHPLVKDANYVVFGVFSPAPLVPTIATLGSYLTTVAPTQTGEDMHSFVFRLAPHHAAAKWENKTTNGMSLVTCLSRSIVVGRAAITASTNPSGTAENDDVKQAEATAQEVDRHQDADYVDETIGPALFLDHPLDHGFTGYSTSFENEPLCVTGNRPDFSTDPASKKHHYYFNIFAVEVFALPKV